MTLKKTLVYSQSDAILDFAMIRAGSETHLVVLDGGQCFSLSIDGHKVRVGTGVS